jgi:hypothetical protein
MEAKDTVINVNDALEADGLSINTPSPTKKFYYDKRKKILSKQAEISFKAGMKEVIDWVNEHQVDTDAVDQWELQLKKWNL